MGDLRHVGVDPPPLDLRKWSLFLVTNHRDWDQDWTLDQMWKRRIDEAGERFVFSHYYDWFPPTEYPRMLIIGAGIGAEVQVAKERGYDAVGIGLLNKAQLNYAEEKGVDLRIMDMHDLRFPNGSFDIVWSNMSFEHGVHPWLMCAEVWAVLRERGRWWMNLPTWQGSDKDGPGHQHFMVLHPWSMVPMLKRSGFRIVQTEDTPATYMFLLEKLELDEISTEPKNIINILRRRLEIGKDYAKEEA